jgi:NAD(P)-dependent dehydrogenase (short-subunit alcohol dehydrogenase family)
MPAEFDITGKVVFITGAGHGIGKGIAQVLAEAGGDIALNALTPTYVEGALRHTKTDVKNPTHRGALAPLGWCSTRRPRD